MKSKDSGAVLVATLVAGSADSSSRAFSHDTSVFCSFLIASKRLTEIPVVFIACDLNRLSCRTHLKIPLILSYAKRDFTNFAKNTTVSACRV